MTTDLSPAIAALSVYATGTAIELSISGSSTIPGTKVVDCERGNVYALGSLEAGSVDSVVGVDLFDEIPDRIHALFTVREVLTEGGTFAFSVSSALPPTAVSSLFKVVGGFEVEITQLGEGSLVVARRSMVQDVRQPFGLQAPFFAAVAQQSDGLRAELYFHLGNVLLRSGDPVLASQCFHSVIRLEPLGSEGYFGLGMCFGSQGNWRDALTVMQQALELDSDNPEAERWVKMAQERLDATVLTPPPKAKGTQAKLIAMGDEIGAMAETLTRLAQLTS